MAPEDGSGLAEVGVERPRLVAFPRYRKTPGLLHKAIEAAWATEFALIIPDARLLTLYVNYAQFGVGLYGICAASWYYFDQPPTLLDDNQSAQLVELLDRGRLHRHLRYRRRPCRRA